MEGPLKTNNTVEENRYLSKILEHETAESLLGKPAWRNEPLPEANFTTLSQFEAALSSWTNVIRQHLPEHDFNMFGDFVQFYRDFVANNSQKSFEFFRNYDAKINSANLNCTGLSFTLLKNLQHSDPQFGSYFALVSSEENIPTVNPNSDSQKYELSSANIVKRHVLICLKFTLSQCDRKGYVLVDSGYNVGHPIVVMSDEAYPHTGWFVPYRLGKVEERHYKSFNSEYIQWEARHINQTTGELETLPLINLIYVAHEYLSYESVTHKRSLVINVKFWIIRNGDKLVAALVSLVDKRNLTILYNPQNDFSPTVKHHFSIDELDSMEVQKVLRNVAECVTQSCLSNDQSSDGAIEQKFQMLRTTLQEYRKALNDSAFCRVICAIDEWILGKKQPIG